MQKTFCGWLILTLASFSPSFAQEAPQPVPSFEELVHLFDYDQKAPLDIQPGATKDFEGVKIHDLTYASPKGGRVPAYLVVPAGKGPYAGIVHQHYGLGDRSEFVPEALALARAGAISLLIDATFIRPAPWTRPGGFGDFAQPEASRDSIVQGVIDLRRGVDLLVSRADIDPKRIGFVGHSYGANIGGILAGVEKRFRSFVLMAGFASATEDMFGASHPGIVVSIQTTPKDQLQKYIQTTAPLDAIHYVGHAAPSSVFLQFARYDLFIPQTSAEKFERAASEPKMTRWYATGHELNCLEALRDRAEWLREQLGLQPVLPLLLKELSPKGGRQ